MGRRSWITRWAQGRPRVLIGGRPRVTDTQSGCADRSRGIWERLEDATLLAMETETSPQAKGCKGPVAAGRGKEMDSPLEPLEL